MSKAQLITVQVKIEATSQTDEVPYVKEWWLQHRVMEALEAHMPVANSLINGVRLSMDSVKFISSEAINRSESDQFLRHGKYILIALDGHEYDVVYENGKEISRERVTNEN